MEVGCGRAGGGDGGGGRIGMGWVVGLGWDGWGAGGMVIEVEIVLKVGVVLRQAEDEGRAGVG